MRGRIPFVDFMEEALYGAGGYYDRQRPRIGDEGDFVTGSSSSPHLGVTTATLLEALDEAVGGKAQFFEAGYGGGEHLEALMSALRAHDAGAERDVIAWDRVSRPVPAGVRAIRDLAEVEDHGLTGLVFSYELFDALPVHRLIRRGSSLRELWVENRDGELAWCEGELTDERLLLWNVESLEEGQIVDATLEWGDLYTALAHRLRRGLMVTFDYGFTRDRLVDCRVRRHGTLACYRRHRVHRNPFTDVGLQDLTAHVDFSLLSEAGEAAGLETVGLFRQAQWLAAEGLLEGMEERTPEERIEIMELMNLEGIGEEIRVLVQAREIDAAKVLPLLTHWC